MPQANLTANMTVSQLGVSFKTLQDLAQSSLPFGVPGDSSIAAYFSNSTEQAVRLLQPKMVRFRAETALTFCKAVLSASMHMLLFSTVVLLCTMSSC
jgi:hypothetical protein